MNGQPETFAFSAENAAEVERIMARYPEGRHASAVLPLLDLAQRQNGGWLPRAAMDHVAGMLGMAPIRVYEVATFYEMFYLHPVGRHQVRICTNLPCMLRGCGDIVEACQDETGALMGETSADGAFTLHEVECLGACVNAPIVWIDDDYYEDLDPEKIKAILKALRNGETPKPGSQTGRQTSCPAPGPTTLTSQKG